ncbi:hypothetical protein V8C35DRAFT_326856 [Trichoderma chlorosporum]
MTWTDDDGVPERLRDPDYRPFDCLDTMTQDIVCDVQRRNMKYLENDPRIKIEDGAQLYIGFDGMISAHGMRTLTREDLSTPTLDFLWGPGAEASVALRLLNKAPKMKHHTWAKAQRTLVNITPDPTQAQGVIAFLQSSIDMERQCWKQLDTLKSAQTLNSIADLEMGAILRSISSLAGSSDEKMDPIKAAEKIDYALSDNMILLRRHYERLQALKGQVESKPAADSQIYVTVQEQMDRFNKIWDEIVGQLFPGRLASEMQKYVDKMQRLCNSDKRYSGSQSEFQWQDEGGMIIELDSDDEGWSN